MPAKNLPLPPIPDDQPDLIPDSEEPELREDIDGEIEKILNEHQMSESTRKKKAYAKSAMAPVRLQAAQREVVALELRIQQRYNYDQIGTVLGISGVSAWRTVKRAMQKLADRNSHNAPILREMINQTYESMLNVYFPQAIKTETDPNDPNAKPTLPANSIKAAEVVMKILDQQAELYGLNRQVPMLNSIPWESLSLEQLEAIERGDDIQTVLRRHK